MALIAVRAVVDIAVHTLMVLIGLSLGMTNRAREDRIVRRVGVAVVASFGAAMIHGEPGVVEGGVRPDLGVMAQRASSGEAGRLMVRVGGVVVVLLVTRVAIG